MECPTLPHSQKQIFFLPKYFIFFKINFKIFQFSEKGIYFRRPLYALVCTIVHSSFKKSDCERIASVAFYKRTAISNLLSLLMTKERGEFHKRIALSLFRSLKTSNSLEKPLREVPTWFCVTRMKNPRKIPCTYPRSTPCYSWETPRLLSQC